MAFMKKQDACDNCGKDLSEVSDKVADGNHEFCSEDCKDEYEADHGHEEDDEAEVCEFC